MPKKSVFLPIYNLQMLCAEHKTIKNYIIIIIIIIIPMQKTKLTQRSLSTMALIYANNLHTDDAH